MWELSWRPRLIAEIGDVRRFHSGSALVAFAGIDSPPYQSGGFIGTQRRISKCSSALLRKTGYEVMKCLKSTKPAQDAVYLFMLKKEAEGKAKKVAMIAALNKLSLQSLIPLAALYLANCAPTVGLLCYTPNGPLEN